MSDRPNPLPPMRIEMATSEIEGAETITWIDPTQVIGCIAHSQPKEAFARYVEPRLAELNRPHDGSASGEGTAALPARVGIVLERLRQIHGRLFRENRSVLRDPRIVRLVVTMVEENRIFFVKGIRCWVFRVREGAATRIRGEEECAPRQAALGSQGRLSLAVTSLPYEAGDVIVLLAAEGGDPPDPRAIASVLEQTQDLKRACDGLVNLFGLESEGAGAVAIRFVPIQTSHAGEAVFFFEDLSRELRAEAANLYTNRPQESLEEIPLPSFLESLESASAAPPPPKAETPSPEIELTLPEMEIPAPVEILKPLPVGARITPPPVEPPAGRREEPASPSAPRRMPRRALALISGAIVILLAVAGVPRGLRLIQGGGDRAGYGVLRIDSVPPARAISIDGVDQGSGTPAILEGIAPGVHRVRLDLGAFGAIEEKVRVRKGESSDFKARGTGALEIVLAEDRPGARMWIRGRSPELPPCTLDTLVAGWHEVYYEDDRIALWQRPVLIRAGETTRLRIPNAFASESALLRIESWDFTDGEGLRETTGFAVHVDGESQGSTPVEIEVTPGLHGIRVESADGRVWTEVCDLRAGCSRVIAPRFGMGEWPQIRHREPGRVLGRGPILLTVEIGTADGAPARNPRLHLPELGPGERDVPLELLDVATGAYVGSVDPAALPLGEAVVYYFTVQTPGGEILCSELFRLTVVHELSGLTH